MFWSDPQAPFLSVPVLHATMTGGVPVVVDGQVAGAVGVSGVKPDQDAEVAHAGIAAVTSLPTFRGEGLQAGVDLDDSAGLLELMDRGDAPG